MLHPLARTAFSAVVIALLPFAAGCGKEAPKNNNSNRGSSSTGSSSTGTSGSGGSQGNSGSQFVEGRAGSTPDRPAPALNEAIFSQVNEFYEEAKQLRNEGQTARQAGNTGEFRRLYNEALDKLREGLEMIPEDALLWYDEADLEGWAIPGAYVAYEQWSAKWVKLESELHKVAR
ncbi:MAG: hypothetical protein AAF196_11060 [Planctomycetota bacterium]